MSYMYNAKEIMESLALDDIVNILSSLQADHKITPDGDAAIAFNAICHSKIHSDEFKPYTHNLVYYDDTKKFVCFSGCKKKSYNIFELIRQVHKTQYNDDMSFYDSLEYVVNLCNIQKNDVKPTNGIFVESTGLDHSEVELTSGWGKTFAFSPLGRKAKQELRTKEIFEQREEDDRNFMENGTIPVLDEIKTINLNNYYLHFSKMIAYNHLWINDYISKETMNKYNIYFDNRNKEIIIPHYDHNHRLVGVRSRLLNPYYIEQQGKYRPTYCNGLCLSHPISQVLYGLDKNAKEIAYRKKAILFEGEKSVLQLDSQLNNSEHNISVAVCGSFISNTQLKLLKDLGVEEIIIAFDKEFKKPEQGTLLQATNIEYTNKYLDYLEKRKKILNKVGRYFNVRYISDSNTNSLLDYKDSPMDRGIEVFMHLCEEAVRYKKEDFY